MRGIARRSGGGDDEATSETFSFPQPPPLNLRAAALRERRKGGCLPLCNPPASWDQSSPEELAWAREVADATEHLAGSTVPRATTESLVERAVGGEGEEAALARLKGRLDAAGLRLPTVEIRWRGVSVEFPCRGGSDGGLPNLLSPFSSAFRALRKGFGGSTETVTTALDDSFGVLRPGTATLLLGPAGSGKTTLLRALSGRGATPSRGEITYNGVSRGAGFSLPRTVSYVSAADEHIPVLTVRETLRFAEECHGGDPTLRPLLESLVTLERRKGDGSAPSAKSARDDALDRLVAAVCNPSNAAATEWILRVLRLSRAADTVVGGDALHRGVSGGERRRVSTGELLVGAARGLCLDEVSTGLDSASTAALARSLRSSARDLDITVFAALLAPEPEATEAFDDLVLLGPGGKTLYHGPLGEAEAHFASLGLERPPGRDLADFLLDVASIDGRRALFESKQNEEPSSPRPVPTTAELASAFRASPRGVALLREASAPFPRTPETDAELCRGSFAAPRLSLLRTLCRRAARVDLLSADGATAAVTRWLLALLMSSCVGTVFFNLPRDTVEGNQARLAVLFFALFFVITLAVPAIEVAHARRAVVLRQRDDGFYPAYLDAASQAIVAALPVVAVDAVAATMPLYYLSGFSRDPSRVAAFLGVFFLLELGVDALNRALGVWSKELNLGIAVGVVVLLGLEATAGFTLSAGSIPKFWLPLHYVNPMAWAFRTLAISELGGGDERSAAGRSGGVVLALFEIPDSPAMAWAGAAFLIGFYLAMVALGALGLTVLSAPTPPGGRGAAGDEEGGESVAVDVAAAPSSSLPPPPPSSPSSSSLPPPPPLSLAAIDLSYFVPAPKSSDARETKLLDGVTASFAPGTLTALMGPSGAGKTTLLDVLAFRKTAGRVSFGRRDGGIFVGGARAEPRSFSAVSGYVEQSTETHCPLSTVAEAALLSATLRLPRSRDRSAAAAAAEEALALVSLDSPASRNSLVCSLPLEARKRLAIAVELAARPSVLFLDEPTSGLDGRAAAAVARAMRSAASSPSGARTVVATVHQPSRAVFALFDSMLLLAPGGQVAYCGPLGTGGRDDAPLLVGHLRSVLPWREPRAGENAAAWAMESLGVPAEDEGGPNRRPRSAAARAFPETPAARAALSAARRASEDGKGRGPEPLPMPGFLLHLAAHFVRGWRSYSRDPARNTSRFAVTALIAMVLCTIERGKGRAEHVTSLRELNNALGLLYLVSVVLSMDVAFEAQPFVASERNVYYRERAAGAARALPFLLASAAAELPYLLAQSLLFALPVYFSVGYDPSFSKFAFFYLVVALVNSSMWLLAFALVEVTPAVFVASLLLSVACSLFSLLAGFMLPLPLIPKWWSWAFYLNPVSYAIAAVATDQYGGRDDVVVADAPAGSPNKLGPLLSASYGFGGQNAFPSKWEAVGMLFAFCGFFALAAYAGLRMNWQKR